MRPTFRGEFAGAVVEVEVSPPHAASKEDARTSDVARISLNMEGLRERVSAQRTVWRDVCHSRALLGHSMFSESVHDICNGSARSPPSCSQDAPQIRDMPKTF